jgi:hypothetical protein
MEWILWEKKRFFPSLPKNTGKNKALCCAFLLGIDGIPQSAKSACNCGSSDRKPESSEKDNSQLNQRSG